jgi:excisionase family DNA binding protein
VTVAGQKGVLMKNAPKLLSRHEVAAILGISVDTVANLVAAGELNTVRIGKAVRVRQTDVEALIARGGAKTRV